MKKMEKKTDYQKGLEAVATMPKLYLGQEVKTPDGTGIIVKLNMPFNGLYLSPKRAEAVVWSGTSKAAEESGWITRTYSLVDIKPVAAQENSELVEALEEYQSLLVSELNELVGLATVHGWKSTRFQEGEVLREKIKKLKGL